MTKVKILGFSGSLKAGSLNTRLVANALMGANAAGAETRQILLRDYPLPVFDEDLEAREGLPDNARKLKELMKAHHGFLLACPEYNSSITAALKNMIDWVSRPAPGERPLECFGGKVCALMAASPGALGGLRGLVTVRSILGNIGVIVMPDQVAVPQAHQAFDGDGKLKDAEQQKRIENLGATVARTAMRLAG